MTHAPCLPCFKCGKVLGNVWDDADNQPYEGTLFVTSGHYGSTVFDPMDNTRLELNICDECLRNNTHLVYYVQPSATRSYPREDKYKTWNPLEDY